MNDHPLKSLLKKAKKGFRGYPIATVAFYGPDSSKATKAAVGIITTEGASPSVLERWFSDTLDIRNHRPSAKQILEFLRQHGVLTVAMTGAVIGCPHEEGIDYPDGQVCPQCPFWAGRNRWTGEFEH